MKEIIPTGTNRVQIQPRQGLGIGSERNKKKLFAKYLDQNIRCCRKRWQNGIKNLCVWLDWPSIIYLSFNKSIFDSKLKGGTQRRSKLASRRHKQFYAVSSACFVWLLYQLLSKRSTFFSSLFFFQFELLKAHSCWFTLRLKNRKRLP